MSRAAIVTALMLLSVVPHGAPALHAQQAAAPPRGIVNLTGQLYRAQNNNHYTVFLVTPEGVILSDPINRDFSRWLKAEIATRFKVPVRYVLYTHHDWDHASGGVVWADTAEFVGHANMLAELEVPPGVLALPAAEQRMDANRNGLVERSEATGATVEQFGQFDANRDGALSGAEIARGPVGDVYPPSVTFTARHTVTLGGKRVEMIPLGLAHTPDSTVLYFPDERAVFSADVMQIKRLPNALAPTIGSWIDALRTITALDFDIAATGHALAGRKADALESLRYLEDLSKGVAAGVAAGRTLPELQKSLTLDAYKGFERWDTVREAHIASVYATMAGTR
jgi:glyoxylase-like metal-dependent hydrolase (beta-lactamase superfamily II)